MTIEEEEKYNDCIKLVKDEEACQVDDENKEYKYVWKLQLNSSDQAAMKSVFDEHNSVTLKIVSDYGEHEKVIGLGSDYVTPSDPDSDDPEDPVTPPSGGEDPEDPETRPSGEDDSKDPVTPPSDEDDSKDPVTPPSGEDDSKDPVTPPSDEDDSSEHSNSDSDKKDDDKDDDSSSSDNNSGQQSSSSSSATTSASSSAGSSASLGAPTYTAPNKARVSEITVVNMDGTSSRIATHVDGTVSETRALTPTTVMAINDNSTLTSAAPTVINSVNLVVDRSGAIQNSRIENVTAELVATTVNGNISITPQMLNGVKKSVSSQLGTKVATSAIDVKINTTSADGKPVSVILSTGDLKSNASLKSYIMDPVTGGYIMVDAPLVKYDKKTGLIAQGLIGGFEYHYVSLNEAKQIENSIYNSVKLSNEFAKPVSATAGAALDMSKAISPTLNITNARKVEYSVSGKKAVIDPATGLLVIKGDAKGGTVTVSIKVTLKNGKTKTIKSKIKIG